MSMLDFLRSHTQIDYDSLNVDGKSYYDVTCIESQLLTVP
jgi:hypothetical protein